jgi:CheY-like chemotaxis protein
LGWSKLLRSRKFDEKTTNRALETIERSAQVQTQLIEDLLDVSRILQGKLSLNVCPVDLTLTIQAAMETVHLAAQAKSIQIQTRLEPDVGHISGDPSRLQQVIWNLLSNAVKFTPQGGRVQVRLSTNFELKDSVENPDYIESDQQSNNPKSKLHWQQTEGAIENPKLKYAQITVSDTGKGIAPDFLPYVFDYFRQADSTTTRKFGGLGLGLAITRNLVELHGGTIQAESLGEGQGATFIVSLPLMPTAPKTNQDSRQSEQSPDLNGVKLLVVDDDASAREYFTFLLELHGASVTAVASAGEGFTALIQSKPDVLLSDIGMPDVDGYMFIQQVRSLPPEQGGQIPAIALTAYAGEINYQQALSAGFQRHVSKPVEPAKLVEVIANLVGGSEQFVS